MVRLDTLGTIALRDADGQELRSVLTQPKRLALLCYLAVESPHDFHRRDRLFGLFWPEFGQAQARQALRQSLYFLRHAIGEHLVVNRGAEEIGIAPDALRCDVSAFTELLEQNRPEEALALYHGDFLAGFFVADSSAEFEHWLYAMREELRRRAVDAAWKLAEADELRSAGSDAAHWAPFDDTAPESCDSVVCPEELSPEWLVQADRPAIRTIVAARQTGPSTPCMCECDRIHPPG